jgi:hypothetical protein
VVGDWNGDGKDTVGVYAGSAVPGVTAGTWMLRNSNSPGSPDLNFIFNVGTGSAVPLVW